MIGTIHPERSLFLRVDCGSASSHHGELAYELSNGVAGNPIIRSNVSGKYWIVSWEELVKLAQKAGIDDTEAAHAP